jgi:hypothetical protein
MSKNKESISIFDIIQLLKEAWLFGLKKWKIIVIAGLAGGIIGFLYATFNKPTYKGTLSFLLNENEQMPSLNLSSIANLAGLGGMGASTSVNEDKLLFLANSRYILTISMLSEKELNGKKDLLANHYMDMYHMQNGFSSDTVLAGFQHFSHTKVEELTYQENKAMDRIVKKITQDNKALKIESKKKAGIVAQNAGIVILEFTSLDENYTKAFLDEMYTNLSSFYTTKTIQRQLRNYTLIKNRADSIKEILSSKEIYGADIYDRNSNLAKMTARVGIERNRRDVEMLSLMYAEVVKNLEIAKFSLENQTPLFQLIDSPTLPLKMQKDSRIIYTFLGGVILGIATFVFLYAKRFFERAAKETTSARNEVG